MVVQRLGHPCYRNACMEVLRYILGIFLPWQVYLSLWLLKSWFQPFAVALETSGWTFDWVQLKGCGDLNVEEVKMLNETSHYLETLMLVAIAALSCVSWSFLKEAAATLEVIYQTLRTAPSLSWRNLLHLSVLKQGSSHFGEIGPQTRLPKLYYQTKQLRCYDRSLQYHFGIRFAWNLHSFLELSILASQFSTLCSHASISQQPQLSQPSF